MEISYLDLLKLLAGRENRNVSPSTAFALKFSEHEAANTKVYYFADGGLLAIDLDKSEHVVCLEVVMKGGERTGSSG